MPSRLVLSLVLGGSGAVVEYEPLTQGDIY